MTLMTNGSTNGSDLKKQMRKSMDHKEMSEIVDIICEENEGEIDSRSDQAERRNYDLKYDEDDLKALILYAKRAMTGRLPEQRQDRVNKVLMG